MESIFSNVLMFVLGLIGLSFLVTIHELGHFMVAKWNNVKVNTFSIGFGKKLSIKPRYITKTGFNTYFRNAFICC